MRRINNKQNPYVILPALMGNTLEWMQFALYGYMAPIISQLFFPSLDKERSIILALLSLSVSFIARPIGGVFFGHLGDTKGRKVALIVSATMMTIATLLISILPTYKSIGVYSQILLYIFLFFQGFAVSGEFTGAAAFLSEHVSQNKRGLYGSILFGTCYVGKLLSGLLLLTASFFMTSSYILNGGWRFLFLTIAAIGLYIIIIRLFSSETPIFMKHKLDTSSNYMTPSIEILKNKKAYVLKIIFLSSLMASSSYFIIAFIPSFLILKKGFSVSSAMIASVVPLLWTIIILPIAGYFSDKIGRKAIMTFGSQMLLLLLIPSFLLINTGNIYLTIGGNLIICTLIAPVAAPILSTLTELFKTNSRYSGTAISYNLGLLIFGGTTPIISFWLIETLHSNLAPCLYLITTSLITLLSIRTIPETYQLKLTEV